jgi:hypothetical protein
LFVSVARCSTELRSLSPPSLGADLPLNILRKVRYKVVQGYGLWSSCTGVQEGAAVARMDLGVVVESEEPRAPPDVAEAPDT